MMHELSIVTVLKSGGDFGPDYITHIHNNIEDKIHIPFHFVTYSDLELKDSDYRIIPLENNYEGWWSKLEAFRTRGPAIYFDLDTFVVKDLTLFAEKVTHCEDSIWMLERFSGLSGWASGIMAWHGDWRWLLDELTDEDIAKYEWDQKYITAKLLEKEIMPMSVNEQLNALSWKHHCRHGVHEVPEEADVVCFHGKPRPHEVEGFFEG